MKKLSCDEYDAFPSPIDTQYFGIASAKVILYKSCEDAQHQQEILNFLQGFAFTTIINKANDPRNNFWLGRKTNAFLTDMNIQLIKKASVTERHDKDLLIPLDNLPENNQIVHIAEASFEFSRFLNDPYLPLKRAKFIYGDIVKNAFRKAGRFFILFKTSEAIAGFLLFSINASTSSSVIELIAIDQNFKRRGVGQSLLRSMEYYVVKQGINIIQVGTQLDNFDALKFYTLNGFDLLERNSIYHYWPSKAERMVVDQST